MDLFLLQDFNFKRRVCKAKTQRRKAFLVISASFADFKFAFFAFKKEI